MSNTHRLWRAVHWPTAGLVILLASAAMGDIRLGADGKTTAIVVVPASATPVEQTAAKELAGYLSKVSGAEFAVTPESKAPTTGPRLYVGWTIFAKTHGIDTGSMGPESWLIRTIANDVVLIGGRPRGTLYAVYRFLEEVVGVHWWNPWEEGVPSKATLSIRTLDLQGTPTFRYRDIYMLSGHDRGRFAARNRLNRDGDAGIAPEYGGEMDYGPPYHVHTFYTTIPPQTYFKDHPEWFSLIKGKRTHERAQLCLTNADLRRAYLQKLRGYIRQSSAEAEQKGLPAPLVFSVSQNDWHGMCQCPPCQAIAKAEGSEAGPLLDFVNYLADAIKDECPGVFVDTLAYQMTQRAPKTIRPRNNVIVRLCDTTSNFTKPITDPENRRFKEHLLSWAKISKNLRIWDYAVTYAPGYGLPIPTVHTYQPDYQFYAEHNVEGVFTEHEYPILADLRDLKVWLMMKLLENPYRETEELLRTFTDGFYGPAGKHVREYLAKLQSSAEAKPAYLSMNASPVRHRFLDLAFIRDASKIFDQAEQAVGSDPVLLPRVRHARLPLDRATVLRFPQLVQEWKSAGCDPSSIPLDRRAIAARCRDTWCAQIDLRIPEKQRPAERTKADQEVRFVLGRRVNLPLPAKFRDEPPGMVFDFTAEETRNWQDIVKRVPDPEAETGITNRLQLSDEEIVKYKLPMSWGLYNVLEKKTVASSQITPEQVPAPGYHWYKMAEHRIAPSTYLYFFWSWIIQVDIDGVIDPTSPEGVFEIWARIRFEGPAFPHGKAGQTNAICVERVVLRRYVK
ncbi:MAG: DUF4838 domain-containing protein [Phycisphaerae bacterium]|nr:DUF4838 domain-containing protein [Phycisphaerae bacterium]